MGYVRHTISQLFVVYPGASPPPGHAGGRLIVHRERPWLRAVAKRLESLARHATEPAMSSIQMLSCHHLSGPCRSGSSVATVTTASRSMT